MEGEELPPKAGSGWAGDSKGDQTAAGAVRSKARKSKPKSQSSEPSRAAGGGLLNGKLPPGPKELRGAPSK